MRSAIWKPSRAAKRLDEQIVPVADLLDVGDVADEHRPVGVGEDRLALELVVSRSRRVEHLDQAQEVARHREAVGERIGALR
jgi:hypothetical protein